MHPSRSFITLTALAALALNAVAQTVFTEDFESGNLNRWTVYGTQDALSIATPTNRIPTEGLFAAQLSNSSNRMYATSLPDTNGFGITAESFKFGFYYYDGPAAATRVYNEVRNYPSGTFATTNFGQILAIGKFNNVTMVGEAYKATKYQARIVSGTPSGWFNLDATNSPNRSTGWHRFDIERGKNVDSQTVLTFYVDNIVSRVFTNSNANLAWDSVILGPGLGATVGNAWFDGLEIIQGQAYISGHPAGTTNSLGQDATLLVTAYGDAGPLSYQWRKNGTNISGATDSNYTILNTQLTNSGNYSVVVSNILGVKISDAAYLQINPLNLVTVSPTNQLVNIGSNVLFYAEATGGGTVYYQWKFYGTNIPGATGTGFSSTYEIPAATLAHAGPYSVTITNDLGDPATTSDVAQLSVNNFPTITTTTANGTLGQAVDLVLAVNEDFSPQATPFQAFETNALGDRVMFGNPSFSGTTDNFVDNPGLTAVTNSFPAGHASPQVLQASWNWTNNLGPWLRLTTAVGAPAFAANPTIYFGTPLRFDLWTTKDLAVAVGLRETDTTADIGTPAGSGTTIEFVGVGGPGTPPTAQTFVVASNWTTVVLDLPNLLVFSFSAGNGVLNAAAGKGGLEQLSLVPFDGQPGEYTIYLDNFVSVPSNALAFELVSGPVGASLDSATGRVLWTPDAVGSFNFAAKVTDAWGLSSEKSFTVQVTEAVVAPGNLTITANGANLTLNWTNTFQLQSNSVSIGDATKWFDVPGTTTAPHQTTIGAGPVFYRLRN